MSEQEFKIVCPNKYEIDYEKITTVADVVEVLKALQPVFYGHYDGHRLLKRLLPKTDGGEK